MPGDPPVRAGVFLVGHYQKFDHTNIFLKGKVRMLDPETGVTTDLSDKIEVRIREGSSTGTVLASDQITIVGLKA